MKHIARFVDLVAIVLVAAFIYANPGAAQTCPEMVGRWSYGPATEVEVSGTTAYVAMGAVLKIIDITNPATPFELGEISVPGVIDDLAVAGSYVYLAVGDEGLRIIDVGSPAAPVEIASEDWFTATAVAVTAGYAYVTTWDAVFVFDVTMPSYPLILGYVDLLVSGSAVTVSGGYAFITSEDRGSFPPDLVIVNVSDPFNPVEVGALETPANYTVDVVVIGTLAYIADETGLRVVDVSDQTTPVEIGHYSPYFGRSQSVTVDGSYAYLALDHYTFGTVDVIDISTSTAPFLMASFATSAPALGVAASGHQVFVAAGSAGLRISDWWLGTELAFIDAPGRAIDVAVSGTHAFLADDEGLRIMDVSTPSTPTEVGFVAGIVGQIEVSGTYAFVTVEADGLRVFDISDPTTPDEVSFFHTPGGAWISGVALSGGHAYVTTSAGLWVIDVSTPTAPLEAAFFDIPGGVAGVAVSGAYAYVAGFAGLWVIDVSTPSAPVEEGFIATPGSAIGVAVAGEYAYVADDWEGLRVINVSDPTDPREVGFIDPVGGLHISPFGVVVSGTVAYLTQGGTAPFSYLSVVDVSNPAAPVEMGFATTPGDTQGLAVSGNHVFVADLGAGLSIFSECAATPSTPGSTPIGTNVSVTPETATGGTPFTLSFDNVTSAGETSVLSTACPSPPGGYNIADGTADTCFDIATTATFTGSIELCFSWSEGDFTNETGLALFHGEGAGWVDITTRPGYPDSATNVICGSTTTLSPFAVFQAANQPPVAQCTDLTLAAEPGTCQATASIDAGSYDPDGDPFSLDQSPVGPYALGSTDVTLTATDSSGESASCSSVVTVIDEGDPTVAAAISPARFIEEEDDCEDGDGEYDEGGREDDDGEDDGEDDDADEELFQVTFSCSDSCDVAPTVEATLNGVPVANGQLVELEAGDGREPELSDGRLSLEAPVFTLEVSCVDASGNWGHGMAELVINTAD